MGLSRPDVLLVASALQVKVVLEVVTADSELSGGVMVERVQGQAGMVKKRLQVVSFFIREAPFHRSGNSGDASYYASSLPVMYRPGVQRQQTLNSHGPKVP